MEQLTLQYIEALIITSNDVLGMWVTDCRELNRLHEGGNQSDPCTSSVFNLLCRHSDHLHVKHSASPCRQARHHGRKSSETADPGTWILMRPIARSQTTCRAIWNACTHLPPTGPSTSPSPNADIRLKDGALFDNPVHICAGFCSHSVILQVF